MLFLVSTLMLANSIHLEFSIRINIPKYRLIFLNKVFLNALSRIYLAKSIIRFLEVLFYEEIEDSVNKHIFTICISLIVFLIPFFLNKIIYFLINYLNKYFYCTKNFVHTIAHITFKFTKCYNKINLKYF